MGNKEKDFCEVLKEHLQRYPLMGPEDCAKLIYQSEFGGEHMISSAERSLEWVRRELEGTPPAQGEIYEEIGSGIARLHFGPAKAAGMDAEEINRIFLLSAGKGVGSREGQAEKLSLLEQLCCEGCTPFSEEELAAFMEKYRAAGCPSLHHSDRYREAYEPHYRVVKL